VIDEDEMHAWLRQFTEDRCPLTVPFETGPELSEFGIGDVAGCVTMLPGYGLDDSGLFDQPQFEIRIRARETQLADLRATFAELDRALIREIDGVQLWGTWIVLVGRAGGQPVPQQESTRERRSYVCTYFAKAEL
jgi:hypothetical protein